MGISAVPEKNMHHLNATYTKAKREYPVPDLIKLGNFNNYYL